MNERNRFGALKRLLTGRNDESIQNPLTWKSVLEEKMSQTDMSPARFVNTIGKTEKGFYITIVKKNDACSVVFFESNMEFFSSTSAVIVQDGDEPRLVFDFGNELWGVLPRGVETEENVYSSLKHLQDAKKFDPTKQRWHGKFPSVDAALEGLER